MVATGRGGNKRGVGNYRPEGSQETRARELLSMRSCHHIMSVRPIIQGLVSRVSEGESLTRDGLDSRKDHSSPETRRAAKGWRVCGHEALTAIGALRKAHGLSAVLAISQ